MIVSVPADARSLGHKIFPAGFPSGRSGNIAPVPGVCGWRSARWLATVGCAAAALALPAGAGADPAIAVPSPVQVQVSGSTYGQPLAPGFLGLSIEYKALADYLGRNPNAINPVFVALLRALTPGASPVLRVGGDSSDQTWWPGPGMIPPGGISYKLTKRWLAAVHALARQTGARLILGVNVAANRPQIASREARALLAGIGRPYVEAFELGNEPDLYNVFPWYWRRTGGAIRSRANSYGPQQYVAEASKWGAALPQVPLAGPSVANLGWFAQLPLLTSGIHGLSIFTSHRYPLWACQANPSASNYASIANLMADSSSAGLAQSVAPYVASIHQAGLSYRIDEMNSASCEGKSGVSNAFASALWILDTLFNMASVGVDGVNIHTLPGAAYAPFSFSDSAGQWSAQVNPMYYGMLMFAQAFPPGAALESVQAPAGPLKAWATVDQAGTTRVVLINQDPTNPADVQLQLPNYGGALQAESLSAPDGLAATDGVSLGGQSFGDSTTTGVLPAPATTTVTPVVGNEYEVSVPAASAVLLSSG
jgi:hypothetical protein